MIIDDELLSKVFRYGLKIGAEKAFFMNGEFVQYFKKGDKASRRCWYMFSKNPYGRPLRWANSCEPCVYRVVDFYRNLGHTVELFDVPKEIPAQEETNETE